MLEGPKDREREREGALDPSVILPFAVSCSFILCAQGENEGAARRKFVLFGGREKDEEEEAYEGG